MAIAEQLDLFADTQGLTVSGLREILGDDVDEAFLLGGDMDAFLREIEAGSTPRAREIREELRLFLTMGLMKWRMDRRDPGWDSEKRRAESQRPKREAAPKQPKGKEISEGIKELLRSGTREGDVYRLAEGQLDRATYDAAMKVLKGIGFRWDKRAKAHVCEPHGQPQRLWEVLDAGKVVDLKQDLQFFATPPALVARLLELADLKKGMTALEPSAGTGNIALPLLKRLGRGSVLVCEKHEPFLSHLKAASLHLIGGDFLALDPEEACVVTDRVVMNPPFAKGQDIEHVWHAYRFLRPGGILVSVMHPGWQTGGTKREAAFRKWVEERGATIEDVAAGAFKQSGTDIATVILRIVKERA